MRIISDREKQNPSQNLIRYVRLIHYGQENVMSIIDIDEFCFWDLVEFTKSLGYSDRSLFKFLYDGGDGALNPFNSDQHVLEVIQLFKSCLEVTIHLDHVNGPTLNSIPLQVLTSFEDEEETCFEVEEETGFDETGKKDRMSQDFEEGVIDKEFVDEENPVKTYFVAEEEGVDENQHNNNDEQVRPQEEIRVEEHFIAEEEGVDENQHNKEDRSKEEEIREDDEHGNDSEMTKVDELSEYIDESDPGSYIWDDDNSDYEDFDEDVISHQTNRRPSVSIPYNALSVNDSGRFMVGMHFESKKSIKVAITDYACDCRVSLQWLKQDSNRMRVKCATDGCLWHFYASKDQTQKSWIVKTYHPEHKCYSDNRNRLVTARYVALKFRDRILSQLDISVRTMQQLCKEQLNCDVTLSLMRRAKGFVLEEIQGNNDKEFADLWRYIVELKKNNDTSTFILQTTKDESTGVNKFKRFYSCFEALKRGWLAGCRPIIGFDGCFLKSKSKGELLTAIGRDANEHMFPIAWAVVEGENLSSWEWFLKLLIEDLQLGEGSNLTIMSDMQKGLIKAVENLLPNAEHRFCCRHWYGNWARAGYMGGDLKILFWNCARSTYPELFDANLRILEEVKEGAGKSLIRINERKWSKAYLNEDPKCDMIDNNICECFNSLIIASSCKSIISMLEHIRLMVMRRIVRLRKELTNVWFGDISPMARKRLEVSKARYHRCSLDFNGDFGYEVTEGKHKHTVDIRQMRCTCRLWQITGIPCAHGVCAIYHSGGRLEDYVSDWYKRETFMRTYSFSIPPNNGNELWPKCEGMPLILPPNVQKKRGRKKMNRRRGFEEPKASGKRSQYGRIIYCSKCGMEGHNKRGCTGIPIGIATQPHTGMYSSAACTSESVVDNNASVVGIKSRKRRSITTTIGTSASGPLVPPRAAPAIPSPMALLPSRAAPGNRGGRVPPRATPINPGPLVPQSPCSFNRKSVSITGNVAGSTSSSGVLKIGSTQPGHGIKSPGLMYNGKPAITSDKLQEMTAKKRLNIIRKKSVISSQESKAS